MIQTAMKIQYILIVFLIFTTSSCTDKKQNTTQSFYNDFPNGEIRHQESNSINSQNKPYVILVSIDGFRYDYAQRYNANHLNQFDVSAKKLIPAFPSKTFPNHYALVTGLYPGHNGLVSNSFYDRDKKEHYRIQDRKVVEDASYYKGTPLWVLASQQKMVSASMFWVGSEAPIQSVFPTYHFKYNGQVTNQQRVNQTIKWLTLPEKIRPHFITLYFSITDDVGHKYGPNSPQIKEAVQSIDQTIGNLVEQTQSLDLPINIIVVSDHGMLEVDRENVIYPENFIPTGTITSNSFPFMVYADDSVFIDSLYNNLKSDSRRFNVYLKSNIPDRFHYDLNDSRIGDLIIMPKPPYTFGEKTKPLLPGSSTHGYDPFDSPEMGAIFYAKGPAFLKGIRIDSLKNVDVYPLISKILNLDYDPNQIDGHIHSSTPILK
jgi:predicted AlkP superfamily pyrophosphatase or phosphodiesterase